MSKRKASLDELVDLTESSPLPGSLKSRADSPTSLHPGLDTSKYPRTTESDAAPSDASLPSSQHAIDVDSDDHDDLTQIAAPVAGPSKSRRARRTPSPPPSQLLAAHTCPICFSAITNACLTPCGHVLCGSCLFASVKSGIERALAMGMIAGGEGTAARCPVCRALLKGWDGKGGGIIPLKIRTIVTL